jgi:vitamin K-dependent gamma-carboxylase
MKSSRQRSKTLLARVREHAFAPVDIASLVFFRIAFGLLMAWEIWRYYTHGWVAAEWIEPPFHFKYYGFSWVEPWPGNGMYVHWATLGVLGLFIAVGFLYRVSAALFFLGFSYTFLLDEGTYLNHNYLICLFSFLSILVPANRAFSIDAWLNPKIRSQTTPAWTLWLLRAQIGVVYFYGGLAKIEPDWLRGEPMRSWLTKWTDFPVIGRFFRDDWMVYGVSYGGLLLDLLIVPFLLWRRTRVAAFCVALAFHLMNAKWFTIGVFPWLAISATSVFLSPSWPRQVVSIFRRGIISIPVYDRKLTSQRKQWVVLSLVSIYVAIQVLAPLRYLLYPGRVNWTHEGHRFSWRMMLSRINTHAFFYVTDPNSGRTAQVNPREYLNESQMHKMGYRPDMILQFAHYLASVIPHLGAKPLKVEARILNSLNGRKAELFADPNVDLAAEPRSLKHARWLLPMHEPLPPRGEDFSKDPFARQFDGE